MKKILLFIGLILTALVFAYCITNHSEMIERDITSRVQDRMVSGEISKDLTFAVDGRDVYLDGFVSSEQGIEKIVEDVKALDGVRAVKHNLRLLAPTPVAVYEAPDVSDSIATPVDDLSSMDVMPPELPEAQEIETPVISVTSPIQENVAMPQIEAPVEMPVMEVQEPVVLTSAKQCQDEISALVKGKKINFDSGRSAVKSSSYGLLNQIVTAMKDCDDVGLRVHGYTDSSGDAIANRRLSHSRAKSVGMYLLNNGVQQKVRVVGHGANDAIDTNETPEGRANNRRIEFEVVPASEIPNQ